MSEIVEICSSELTVGINTFGAELMYINSKNTSFLWNGDEKIWSGRAPVLFPICGGLKDDKYTYNGIEYVMPKHGFAKKSEFKYTKTSDSKAEFLIESNEDTLKMYPFKFVLCITYEVISNVLSINYTVKNNTDGPMYYSIGSHEAYSCPEGIEEYSVVFDKNINIDSYTVENGLISYDTIKILTDRNELPMKKSYFENDSIVFKDVCFDKVQLVHKKSDKKITVNFNDCDYFVIWTLQDGNYICLEPWQGMGDFVDADGDFSHKKGIIKLKKGETRISTHTIKFEE